MTDLAHHVGSRDADIEVGPAFANPLGQILRSHRIRSRCLGLGGTLAILLVTGSTMSQAVRERIGELGVLKSHELDIELSAPQVIKQGKLEDEKPKGKKGGDSELTPEKALAKSLEAEKA